MNVSPYCINTFLSYNKIFETSPSEFKQEENLFKIKADVKKNAKTDLKGLSKIETYGTLFTWRAFQKDFLIISPTLLK